MNYNLRIDDNYLKGEYKDGEVLQHTDLNTLENVVKVGINANYEDIQKLTSGVIPAGAAEGLVADEGVAILSQYSTEDLQATDSKIPSALQVKTYIDNLFNSANIGLIYYWDGTSTQASVNLFNTLCDKYDNNEPFVLFGRFQVEFELIDEHDEPYIDYRQVVSPIIVNKVIDIEESSYQDFVTPPIMYADKYAVGSVHLTGNWGEFTAVEAASWSTPMTPISVGKVNAAIQNLQAQLNALINGDEVEF